eukprot:SAG31_NODE_7275_length_1736_cov_4.816127_1_plen_57_part_00
MGGSWVTGSLPAGHAIAAAPRAVAVSVVIKSSTARAGGIRQAGVDGWRRDGGEERR